MKQLTFLFLLSVALSACQKEVSFDSPVEGNTTGTNNGTYYIKCKVNGTSRTFNFNGMAKVTSFPGFIGFNLIGSATSDVSNMEGINLGINFVTGTPAAGTYSESDTTTKYVVAGVYNPNSSTQIYSAGIATPTVLPLTITIGKIDGVQAEGTFKGAFYKQDMGSGQISNTEYVSLTEGEFKVPVK